MKLERLFSYLFLLLLPSLVVSFASNSIILAILSIISIVQLRGNYTKPFFRKYVLFSAFIASVIIGLLIDVLLHDKFDSRHLTKRAAFILMPFIIYYAKKDVQLLSLKVFVYFLSFMSSALILFGFIRSLLNRDKILYGNWDSKTTEAFYEHDMLINWGELSYKRLFFNLDMHPSYYALFSTIAILVLLFTHFIDIKKSFKWVLVVLHTVMIILVSSKAGLVSLFVIFILAFFFDTEIKQRLILASAVLIIVISSLSVPSTQLRIKRAYQSMLSDGTEILDSSSAERITLWKSLEYYSVSELLLGTGIQTSRTKTKSYTGIDKNMHNQFLQSLVSSGIIGLLLLICFLLSPLLYNRGPFIYVFILVVVLNLTLENMFDRVWGVVFVSFFYGLFIFGDLNFSLKKPLEIEN
jgi:hypothetical protein